MKKGIIYLLWAILVVLVAIQFVPVDRSNPEVDMNDDFLSVTNASAEVQEIIRSSCYDCHSNETNWPWYAYVAPVSFVIKSHVEEGRENLNFSEWATYEMDDYPAILKHMKKEIDKGAMPLQGYVKLHAGAEITDAEKTIIYAWIEQVLVHDFPISSE